MIKFIVCDDIKEFRLKIKDFINDVLVGSKLEYDVIQFEKYDKDFAKLIKDDGAAKIYILDIELKEGISGIDIARRIRKVDWNSIIIMVTSHNELGYDALKAQIMLLDFISKYDNCEKNLKRVLKKAIKQIDSKKVIAYEYLGVAYRVYLDDIIYVDDHESNLDYYNKKAKQRHIQRVTNKTEKSVIVNSTYVDILSNLERIGDHCQNIAESYMLEEENFKPDYEVDSAFNQ